MITQLTPDEAIDVIYQEIIANIDRYFDETAMQQPQAQRILSLAKDGVASGVAVIFTSAGS